MRKTHVAVALLASLQFSAFGKVTEARVMVVKGSVTATAPSSSTPMQPVRDSAIQVGSAIGTAGASSLLMEPNPGSAVFVLEKSNVVLSEDDLKKKGETIIGRKTVLDLNKGHVQAALAHPKGADVEFKVSTPQCVAAARGTVFGVDSQGNSSVIVCGQGTVRVSWIKNGHKVFEDVPAGMQLIVNSDGTSTLEPATPAELASLQEFAQSTAYAFGGGGKEGAPPVDVTPIGNLGPDTSAGDPGVYGVPGATGVLGTSGTMQVSGTLPPQTSGTFPPQETPFTNQ